MSRQLMVGVALAILLVQATPAAACCLTCIGEKPNEICIPPGCDDLPTLPPVPPRP